LRKRARFRHTVEVSLDHCEPVVTMAPRISRHVLEAVFKRDDPVVPIAETYRSVAAEAERLGYTRPSYEQIRVFVHRARRIRKQPTTTEILLDIAAQQRHPDELTTHFTGPGVRIIRR
jgi:hypothetical protein